MLVNDLSFGKQKRLRDSKGKLNERKGRMREKGKIECKLYNLGLNCVIDFGDFGTLVNYGLSTLQKILLASLLLFSLAELLHCCREDNNLID